MASSSDLNENNFSRMQHLINEMNASNHRIDLFTQQIDSDAVKSNVNSTKKPSVMERQFDALYDDAWKSEESDGASLQEVPIYVANDTGVSGCEDTVNSVIAEVSNDFLSGLRHSVAQNQYIDSDESRISSDNDIKLLTGMASYCRYPETANGLSDTDWNPYGTESDNNQSPRMILQDSAGDSKTSVLSSFTPLFNSTDLNSITPSSLAKISHLNDERMHDILERTERESTLRHSLIPNESEVLSAKSMLKHIVSPVSRPRYPSDDEKQITKLEKELMNLNSKDLPPSDQEKKMAASTSSTGYSSAPSSHKYPDEDEGRPLSVIERAKLLGAPEEILEDRKSKPRLPRTEEFHHSFSDTLENESDNQLSKKVRALLSDTTLFSSNKGNGTQNGSTMDYTVLQRDLQEIQDNLDNFGIHPSDDDKTMTVKSKSRTSSEGEGDIIPSTTTTPEKKKDRMLWDFAGDIGCLDPHQHIGLMGEISLNTQTTSSNRPSTEKTLYNSDGDETRTSESSAKNDDNGNVELGYSGMMGEVRDEPLRNLNSSLDVDRMVSSFQDQRRQLESRYQEINNQGLAEKVYRILTNQNPGSQANVILSEISADEKEMKKRIALDMRDKDFNYSSTSSWLDDVNHSFNPINDVRKKLDLSEVSSVDSSLHFDKQSNKGFTALEDARRLLSSQMTKASERTFNHSIELKLPPTEIQCYPLLVEGNQGNGTEESNLSQVEEKAQKDDTPEKPISDNGLQCNNNNETSGTLHLQSRRQNDEPDMSNPSPTNSDQGSSVRHRDKYRPYRPPGSKEVYYTESDTASVADSVTTMESTHFGSDDARGPSFPTHVLGSRKDAPNVAGIYSTKQLSTVREDTVLGTIEEKNETNSDSRNNSKREGSTSPTVTDELPHKKEQNVHLSSHPTEHYSPNAVSRTRSEDESKYHNMGSRNDPIISIDRRRNNSPTQGIDAARRDARWSHQNETVRDGQGYERVTNLNGTGSSPNRSTESNRITYSRDNMSPGDRFMNSEKNQEYRVRKISPSERVQNLRREARWAHRTDEVDRGQGEYDEVDNKPLSLRVKMTYSSDGRKERDYNISSQYDLRTGIRTSPHSEYLKDHSRSGNVYSDDEIYRVTSDEYLDSRDAQLSEAFRSAMYHERRVGLTRSASDECLHSPTRDARLSPAFRRALSPELRTSIERRSPVLSRHLERSLAQPPSDYPIVNRRIPEGRSDLPPTFLARERSYSPSYSFRQPFNNEPQRVSRESFTNQRAPSPEHVIRSIPRYETQNERPRERVILNEGNQYDHYSHGDPIIKSKRKVEMTLEGMSSESEVDLEMDQEPLTKRAQLLKNALSNDRDPSIGQDVNAMWEKFKAMNDSGTSSINSTKLESVADLLKSPSRHLVSQYVRDREEYRIERQERAEIERERRLQEQQMNKHSSSEDEIQERYAELLAIKDEERARRRALKKKKGKGNYTTHASEGKNDKKSLFSIPEDRSNDPSPSKSHTPSKSKKPHSARQSNVIDPNMLKLREKISNQKSKVDKDMLKEMRRIEKLKMLESLLIAKKKGKISDETLQNQLEDISSTSAVASDFSVESGVDNKKSKGDYSDDSTTAKDSSAEMHAWKAEKEKRQKFFQQQKLIESERSLKEKQNRHSKNKTHSRYRKGSPDVSEIRLLKLVKEGYLTPEEAYRLAVERATKEGCTLDLSRESSLNGSLIILEKPHKTYSPYSRDIDQSFHLRHSPKIKFTKSSPHPLYGLDYLELDESDIHSKENREKRVSRKPEEKKSKGYSSHQGRTFSPSWIKTSFFPNSAMYSSLQDERGTSYNSYASRKPKHGAFHMKKFLSENDAALNNKVKNPVAWDIPMDLPANQWKLPKQPLREVTSTITNKQEKDKPLERAPNGKNINWDIKETAKQEQQNIWSKQAHPKGIPKEEWKRVVLSDALACKTNHWEVDPMTDRVQYILNKPGTNCGDQSYRSQLSQDGDMNRKQGCKMSLQDAFVMKNQKFISKSSERQKRLRLSRENRQLQECFRLEREAIFAEQDRLPAPNLYAHPYSDNLYQPKHRVFTKQEMKQITSRKYQKLPEVVGKKEEDKKKVEAKLNRLRSSLFTKKVQRDVLRKALKQRA